MPAKRHTLNNFKGIGNGTLEGEYYYGENLKPGQFGPANVKTIDGLATASVKTVDGLAIANVKTINGLN